MVWVCLGTRVYLLHQYRRNIKWNNSECEGITLRKHNYACKISFKGPKLWERSIFLLSRGKMQIMIIIYLKYVLGGIFFKYFVFYVDLSN